MISSALLIIKERFLPAVTSKLLSRSPVHLLAAQYEDSSTVKLHFTIEPFVLHAPVASAEGKIPRKIHMPGTGWVSSMLRCVPLVPQTFLHGSFCLLACDRAWAHHHLWHYICSNRPYQNLRYHICWRAIFNPRRLHKHINLDVVQECDIIDSICAIDLWLTSRQGS